MNTSRRALTAAVAAFCTAFTGGVLASDFSLQNNQVTAEGARDIASSGQIDNISSSINTTPGNIPDMSFTLVNNNAVANGTYDLRMGLIIKHQTLDRRLEASMGVIRVTTDGTGAISSISLLTTEDLEVKTKLGTSATLTYTRAADVNVLNFAGATVTVRPSDILAGLVAENAVFENIVKELTQSGSYNYRIALQPVAGSPRVGYLNGATFSPFARMQTNCSLNAASRSGENFTLGHAGNFGSAYAVHGVLSLGGAAAGAGFTALTENCVAAVTPTPPPPATPPVPPPSPALAPVITQAGTVATNVTTVLGQGGDQSQANTVVSQFNTTIGSGVSQLANAGTNVNPGQLVTVANLQTNVFTKVIQSSVSNDIRNALLDNSVRTLGVAGNTRLGEEQKLNVKNLLQESAKLADTLPSDDAVKKQSQLLGASANSRIAPTPETVNTFQRTVKRNSDTNPVTVRTPSDFDFVTNKAVKVQFKKPVTLKLPVADTSNYDEDLLSLAKIINGKLEYYGGKYNSDSNSFIMKRNSFLSAPNDDGRQVQAFTVPVTPGITTDEFGVDTVRNEDGEVFTLVTVGVAYYSPDFPAGIYPNLDGTFMVIDSGIGMKVAMAPANLTAAFIGLFDLGYTPALEEAGVLAVTLNDQETFSGTFAWQDLAGATGECTAVSYEGPTEGGVLSASWNFTAVCNNGLRQKITPAVLDQDLYESLRASGVDFFADRETGFLSVPGVGMFRPDFFVSALSTADEAFLAANADAAGVAFRTGDFDGNGVTDYEVLSEMGKQVVWGVN